MAKCKHCGQQILVWHGVPLQRRKIEIAEAIERRDQGITLQSLVGIFYPGDDMERAAFRIRSHVHQINETMLATDWRIRNIGGFYRVVSDAEETA